MTATNNNKKSSNNNNLLEAIDQKIVVHKSEQRRLSQSRQEFKEAYVVSVLEQVRKLIVAYQERIVKELEAKTKELRKDPTEFDYGRIWGIDFAITIITEGKEQGEDNKK